MTEGSFRNRNQLKKIRNRIGAAALLICALWMAAKGMGNSAFSAALSREVNRQLEQAFFVLPDYLKNGENKSGLISVMEQAMSRKLPLYHYAGQYAGKEQKEDRLLADRIRHSEGGDEDHKQIEEESLDYGEDALHIENSMLAEMEQENSRYKEEGKEGEVLKGESEAEKPKENEEPVKAEGFQIPEYPAYTYDWSENWGYQELLSNFFAVDATTVLKEEYADLDQLLYQDLSLKQEGEGPQILIYHTHSQEAFADSVPGDPSTTIVGAGARLAQLLEEQYGFRVMHHTGEYDVESRDDAYAVSLPALEQILAENPSIEVVIDVHRDEMREGKKLVMDLQGRPTARFMFFNGMSHIREKGDISYLENEFIRDNLAFSFQAQVAANEYYPGIARKIYLKAYRYNLHLRKKSMLIELGAQTNTVEEILNACDPIAHIIAIVLGGRI